MGGQCHSQPSRSRVTQGSSPKALLTFRWALLAKGLGCLSWWEGVWPDHLPQTSIWGISLFPPRRKAEMGSGHSLVHPSHLPHPLPPPPCPCPALQEPHAAVRIQIRQNRIAHSPAPQLSRTPGLQPPGHSGGMACRQNVPSQKVPDCSLLSWPLSFVPCVKGEAVAGQPDLCLRLRCWAGSTLLKGEPAAGSPLGLPSLLAPTHVPEGGASARMRAVAESLMSPPRHWSMASAQCQISRGMI